jgi:hypothetical protein
MINYRLAAIVFAGAISHLQRYSRLVWGNEG